MTNFKDYPSAAKLCRELGIKADKNLGQNFLDKQESITKMLSVFDLNENSQVLEIGPGLGHMSHSLLEKGVELHSIEIDKRFEPVLTKLAEAYPKFHIIWADALELDWSKLFLQKKDLYLIANLPYYLSTDLFIKALLELFEAKGMSFLLQREVAEKFAAQPGSKDYGPPAALADLYGKKNLGLRLPAGSFYPPPTIESRVLNLKKEPLQDSAISDSYNFEEINNFSAISPITLKEFWIFLVDVFQTRRKTLRNNLKSMLEKTYPDESVKVLDSLDSSHNDELTKRPEMLSGHQLWYIFNAIKRLV